MYKKKKHEAGIQEMKKNKKMINAKQDLNLLASPKAKPIDEIKIIPLQLGKTCVFLLFWKTIVQNDSLQVYNALPYLVEHI